jgi:hypothetical protein
VRLVVAVVRVACSSEAKSHSMTERFYVLTTVQLRGTHLHGFAHIMRFYATSRIASARTSGRPNDRFVIRIAFANWSC